MPPAVLRRFLHLRRRSLAVAAVVRQDTSAWVQAPVSRVSPACKDGSLFHISVDISDAPTLAAAYTSPGQYLQVRPAGGDYRPTLLAIASPPSFAAAKSQFEFLVKKVTGSVAEAICGLGDGDLVEIGAIMGKGFPVHRISPPETAKTVLIFATGSGISPIRSLIESGFNANERSDVRLYYGAWNLERMAYQV